jgi:hypothetical protein
MLAKILKVADISTLQIEGNVLEVDAAKVERQEKHAAQDGRGNSRVGDPEW